MRHAGGVVELIPPERDRHHRHACSQRLDHGAVSGAPVIWTSGARTESASTRTSWPRSTNARITDVSAGTLPPPSMIANR
jgi:hypothetical protein